MRNKTTLAQSVNNSIRVRLSGDFKEPLAFAREYGGQKFFLQIKNFCISLQCNNIVRNHLIFSESFNLNRLPLFWRAVRLYRSHDVVATPFQRFLVFNQFNF